MHKTRKERATEHITLYVLGQSIPTSHKATIFNKRRASGRVRTPEGALSLDLEGESVKKYGLLFVTAWLMLSNSVWAQEEDKSVEYAGVRCVLDDSPRSKIHCGLFPLKQVIGLVMERYVDRKKLSVITEAAVDAGLSAIKSYDYDASKLSMSEVYLPFESVRTAYEDYNPTNSQWRQMTARLEPLINKLAQVYPNVSKLGYRADELLLYEVRKVAIDAVVSNLDPHSELLLKGSDEWKILRNYLNYTREDGGVYGGIGGVVGQSGQSVFFVAIYPDTPAFEKIQRYDQILEVDDVMINDRIGAVAALRGEPGTSVRLVVRRDGQKIGLTLIREEIPGRSVTAQLYDLGDTKICYLFIGRFVEKTHEEVKNFLAPGGVCESADNLALDLRQNSGGAYESVVPIGQMLQSSLGSTVLPPDPLMKVHTNESDFFEFRDPDMATHSWKSPVVVLTSSVTASGSELVIGMLQSSLSGLVLVGDRTFGKTSGWQSFLLADGSLFTLTETNFYFRDGLNHNGKGFVPDIYYSARSFGRLEIPQEVRREENLNRSHGQTLAETDKEKLTDFISRYDPELAIAFGIFVSEKFSWKKQTQANDPKPQAGGGKEN